MKVSELTPEVADFAKRLKSTYTGGGHGDKWASRTYALTLDDSDEVVGYQFLHTTRKGYDHEWRKGKLSYAIKGEEKKEYKDLNEFLAILMQRNSLKLIPKKEGGN